MSRFGRVTVITMIACAGVITACGREPAASPPSDVITVDTPRLPGDEPDTTTTPPAATPLEFTIADGLAALDTPHHGWHYQPQPLPDSLTGLAAVFGIDQPAELRTDTWGEGWQLGTDDPTTAHLWVNPAGVQHWSYTDVNGTLTFTVDDPLERAAALFTALNVPGDAITLDSIRTADGHLVVTGHDLRDGHPSGLTHTAIFDADQRLIHATGFLAVPVRSQPFERVGVSAALGDHPFTSAPGDDPTSTSAVTVIAAEFSWWPAPTATDGLWLLPGYTVTDDRDHTWQLPAIAADRLSIPTRPQ